MDLKNIISISGKPGLYRNIAQTKNGVIVESMIDGKRFQAFGSDKISSLGEISIYTHTGELELREVFRLIKEKIGELAAPGAKSSDSELVELFKSVVPEYDSERFYISHMRKIVGWYNLLIENGHTDFSPSEDSHQSVPESSSGDVTQNEEAHE